MFKGLKRVARKTLGLALGAQPSTKQYSIGRLEITLPWHHELPHNQEEHPLYDRFLPLLCKKIRDGWIVDVGANVGDTSIAIAQVCSNPIIAIEGDETFAKLLNQNIKLVPDKIRAITALVGTNSVRGSLISSGTTATRAVDSLGTPSIPLDDILHDASVTSVALIKVDTDGYDGDVILSGMGVIKASRPILFWENYFSTIAQKDCFSPCYQALEKIGYHHLWIFDNFGNLMFADCTFKTLKEVNEYIAAQERGTRTVYYTDILAVADCHLETVQHAVDRYREMDGRVNSQGLNR